MLLGDEDILCANAGDSRAVLCRDGRALELSHDHKPNLPSERARIVAAGGSVTQQKAEGRIVHRVNGALSLSRAIGDLTHKQNTRIRPENQAVTALPEMVHAVRTPADEFIVIACDGIWDVKTSQEVVDFVRRRLRKGQNPKEVSEELIRSCLSSDPKENHGLGTDNMTCIVIALKDFAQRPTSGKMFSLPSLLQNINLANYGLALQSKSKEQPVGASNARQEEALICL